MGDLNEILANIINIAVGKYFKNAVEEVRKYDAMPEVLTLPEAAKLLRVSSDWLRKNLKECAIPHFKTGSDYKFRKKQLLEWIDENIDILRRNGKGKIKKCS